MLKSIAENVWSVESVVKLSLGLRLPARSTVLKLNSGELMVISPVKTSDETIAEIKKLGAVKYVIAPNCMHHLFLKEFADHFPYCEIWGPHCLQDKRKDISFKGILSVNETMPWEADVDMIVVKAKAPMVQEFIFYHRSSKTVVLTDLFFNMQHFDHWFASVFARLNGGYKRLGMTRIGKSVFNDRASLHQAASHILSWNPANLLVGHGDVIINTAREALLKPLSEFAAINS